MRRLKNNEAKEIFDAFVDTLIETTHDSTCSKMTSNTNDCNCWRKEPTAVYYKYRPVFRTQPTEVAG